MQAFDANRLEKRLKITRYQKNVISYRLTLAAIALELWYTILLLDDIATEPIIGAATFLNTGLLFVLFLSAVKMNVYDRKWSALSLAVAAYLPARALWLLPDMLRPEHSLGMLTALTVAQAALLLISSIYSLVVIAKRARYIQPASKED